MSSIGNLKMQILIRVGDGEPVEMGEVSVPLTAGYEKGVLTVNVKDAIDYVSVSLQQVFGPQSAAPPTPASPLAERDEEVK